MGEGVVVSEAQHALTFIKSKWRRRTALLSPMLLGGSAGCAPPIAPESKTTSECLRRRS